MRSQTSAVAIQSAAPIPVVKAPVVLKEPRFDLVLTDAPAREVFMSLVVDTPWSVSLHPDIKGTISTTLRRVTVKEALEALREMYGYDFRVDNNRISIFAPTAQTRSFVVNYLTSQRNGQSDSRVNSGSNAPNTSSSSTTGSTSSTGTTTNSGSTPSSNGSISTQLQTSSQADLWKEMGDAVKSMIEPGAGKHVLITPQASLITVRALPDELRQVEQYLQSVKGAVQRQVMLEAKIIDVELNDNYQSGVDWTRLFTSSEGTVALGSLTKDNGITQALSASGTNIPNLVGLPNLAAGAFGLSIGSNNFQAVLGFLESFGDTKVLSSPRIATLNNQRALLKVGTDEFFITSATPGSTSSASTSSSSAVVNPPTLNWASFFSGIALDVTPQIDETNTVTMHVRPSVSTVQEKTRQLNLGTAGNYSLPTASSNVNETDTIVRIGDGQIVAIGGLMQMSSDNGISGLPGASQAGVFGTLMGNTKRTGKKRELVILIKPTVIKTSSDWSSTWASATSLMDVPASKVIEITGTPKDKPAFKLSNQLSVVPSK